MDVQKSVQQPQSLPHAGQPQPLLMAALILVSKPCPIVRHRQPDSFRGPAQLDQDFRRMGMFRHVLKSFLEHPEQARGDIGTQRIGHVSDFQRNVQTASLHGLMNMFIERRLQSGMFQQGGVQSMG